MLILNRNRKKQGGNRWCWKGEKNAEAKTWFYKMV